MRTTFTRVRWNPCHDVWDHTGAEPRKTWASRLSCSNVQLMFRSLGQRAFVNWAFPCLANSRPEPFAPYGNRKTRFPGLLSNRDWDAKGSHALDSLQQANIWRNVSLETVSSSNCISKLVVKAWIQKVLLQNAQTWLKSFELSCFLLCLSNISTCLLSHSHFYFLLSSLSCLSLLSSCLFTHFLFSSFHYFLLLDASFLSSFPVISCFPQIIFLFFIYFFPSLGKKLV